jgi:hypothetical protein
MYKNKKGEKVKIKEMDNDYLQNSFKFFKKNLRKLFALRRSLNRFKYFDIVKKFIKTTDKDVEKVKKIVKALNQELKNRELS